jgi:hypothetical protein
MTGGMTTVGSARAWFGDAVSLLALVWTIPLAILLVGAPLALAVALMLWLARLARSAF